MRIAPPAAALAACLLCAAVDAQPPQPADPASVVRAPRVAADAAASTDMSTERERAAARQRALNAPTPAECRRMRDEQLKSSAEHARNRGIKDVPNARMDLCGE